MMNKKAQVSLELGIAFLCMLLLFFAAFKIFVWMNTQLVQRQIDYERSREEAGALDFIGGSEAGHAGPDLEEAFNQQAEGIINYENAEAPAYENLHIFKEDEQ